MSISRHELEQHSKRAVHGKIGEDASLIPNAERGSADKVNDVGGFVEFSPEEFERYSRQLVLRDIGFEGQRRLKEASVCVAGVGGLGYQAAVMLAAMGVGRLRIVDRDIVELSNLHRQFFDLSYLGLPKVEAAAERIARLNPSVSVEPIPDSIHAENAREILTGTDLVVDGLDSMGARYAVNRACLGLGIPYVYGSALESFGMVSTIVPWETACLECMIPEFNDNAPTCATVGVHTAVLGVVLSIEVSEAVRIIIGKKPLLAGKLLVIDLRDLVLDKASISRADTCPACGSSKSAAPEASKRRIIEEVCGRKGARSFISTPDKPLAMDSSVLASLLSSKGFRILGVSKLSVSFGDEEGTEYTFLSSGVIVIKGNLELEDALKSSRFLWDLAQTR